MVARCAFLCICGGHRIWQESGTVWWLNGEAHSEGTERGHVMWYVIWVETGKEHQVRTMIEKQISSDSYERIVIPEKLIQKKIKGKWQKIQSVLIPGYIFVVAEDITDFARELSGILTFARMLTVDGRITAIYPEEEAVLRRLVDKDEVVDISKGIIVDDKVIITEGPLKGMEGMIKKIDRHRRTAAIEIEMFDRKVLMNVGLEIVEKK